jgi:regulatory protein
LLNYRLRSRHELEQALLQRRYSHEEVRTALNELEAVGLVNDPQFAKSLAETRVLVSRRGRQAIFFELLKKGLDKELIKGTLNNLDQGAELEAAQSLSESRLKQWRNLEPLKRRARLLSLLQRRGFPSTVIREILTKFRGRL